MSSRLEDVVSLIADCEHKSAPTDTSAETYAHLVGTPSLRNGRILLANTKGVNKQVYEAWTRRGRPQRGDLILAREAPVGEVGYVDGEKRLCLGQRIVLIRPDTRLANPRFLHYLLLGPSVQRWILERASGSTVPHLNVADVRKIDLGTLPRLDEQVAIAHVLGLLDDKLEPNRRLADLLEQLAAAMLQQAAEGAERKLLGDVAEIRKGLSYKGAGLADEGMPMVNLANAATFGGFKRTGWKYYTGDYKPRHVARGGALLVANTDLTWKLEALGWPMLLPDDVPEALFSQDVSIIDFADKWLHLRLPVSAHLFTTAARARVEGTAHGTTVAALPAETLTGLEVQLIDASAPVLADAEALLQRAWAAERESEALARLRNALLPPLMSGRLRVREAEQLAAESV